MAKRLKLGELLVRAGAIDRAQLEAALGEQGKRGTPLGMTIVRMGFLDEETLVRTLARQLKLPLAWLRGKRIKPEVLGLVPDELAMKYRCLPLSTSEVPGGRVLFLAMQDPADLAAADDVASHAGCKVKPVLAAPGELEEALERHYQIDDVATQIDDVGAPESEQPLHDESESLELTASDWLAGEEEPEILLLDREVQFSPVDGDSPLKFVNEPAASATNATLEALAQFVAALIDEGVLTRDDLDRRLGDLVSRVPGSR